jgi:transcription initiation factor IIE alpha subunit
VYNTLTSQNQSITEISKKSGLSAPQRILYYLRREGRAQYYFCKNPRTGRKSQMWYITATELDYWL